MSSFTVLNFGLSYLYSYIFYILLVPPNSRTLYNYCDTQDVYHIEVLPCVASILHLLPLGFTLFVTPTKDHNNHDNLIFRRGGYSRARYKETIREDGRDKQWKAGRGRQGVWESKYQRWDKTLRLGVDRQSDLHTDRRMVLSGGM